MRSMDSMIFPYETNETPGPREQRSPGVKHGLKTVFFF